MQWFTEFTKLFFIILRIKIIFHLKRVNSLCLKRSNRTTKATFIVSQNIEKCLSWETGIINKTNSVNFLMWRRGSSRETRHRIGSRSAVGPEGEKNIRSHDCQMIFTQLLNPHPVTICQGWKQTFCIHDWPVSQSWGRLWFSAPPPALNGPWEC